MAAFDGSIRIDSKIESKGFNSGIKSMIASVGKLAVAIASAFAVRAVVQFGKTAVDEASKMASALIGLQSVVEGTGNSLKVAQDFINSFTADGLVPAGDAITAYKNLLLRGYDTSQIESTLKALKDSAAFGRSAHLTLGEAVKTATEGLRNENSILVDNAGVTKNISIIWRDYAESIGTTVAALTKEQKIQAEVLGIMEETKFQTGDAAKLSGTYAGQVSALGVSFLNLKVAIGNVIIPIATRVIPYIRAAIDALVIFFNRLATLMSLFFGIDQNANAASAAMGGVADNTNAAADAQDGLAESTKKSEKAAKGALAAFDDLNVLQRPEGEAGEAEVPAIAPLPVIDTVKTDETLEALKVKVNDFKQKLLDLFGPAIASFEKLKIALEPLGKLIIEGLGWAWENILVPFGKWAIEMLLPRFFDLLAAAVRLLVAALEFLSPVFSWLWEHILKPLAGAAGTFILIAIEGWTMAFNDLATWIETHPNLFGSILASAGKLWETVKVLSITAFQNVIAVWAGIALWFYANVWTPLMNGFGIALKFIQKLFANVFDGIKGFVRGAFNSIIDYINGLIDSITTAINTIVNGFNAVGSLAPGFVPLSNITAPRIPKLAQGAVIPANAQFAAILGDQRNGRNIEAPEGLIRQIVREETGKMQAEISIRFEGSLSQLVRELKPIIDKENVRIGGSLINSKASV